MDPLFKMLLGNVFGGCVSWPSLGKKAQICTISNPKMQYKFNWTALLVFASLISLAQLNTVMAVDLSWWFNEKTVDYEMSSSWNAKYFKV